MVNHIKRNQQEVKSGTLGSNTSVGFSHEVDILLSLFGLNLLVLNFSGSGFGGLKRLNQGDIGQDGIWVSLRKILKQVGLKLSKRHQELVLLVHKLLLGSLKIWLLHAHN